jgi:hypothetical protein
MRRGSLQGLTVKPQQDGQGRRSLGLTIPFIEHPSEVELSSRNQLPFAALQVIERAGPAAEGNGLPSKFDAWPFGRFVNHGHTATLGERVVGYLQVSPACPNFKV